MEISNGQAMSSHVLEELLISYPPPPPPPSEKKPRHEPEQALKCPRCNSANTKFCYYNNYSLSQPRHFCKGCRRYWTRGGSLRNVPVGGGCRKNRRPSSSPSSSPSSTSIINPPSKRPPNYDQTNFMSYINHGDMMNLAFARHLWPSLADHEHIFHGNPNPNINGFQTLNYGNNGKVLMDLQMPNGVDGGLGMEYSSCHGLINSSLM